MRITVFFLVALLMAAGSTAGAEKPRRMAFGYIANSSPSAEYDYLETILQRTISKTLSVIFKIPVQNPDQLNARLQKESLFIQREYLAHELPALVQKLETDIFIYGNFELQKGTMMKLTMNCYYYGSDMLFTFTHTDKIAADMSGLIDKSAAALANFMADKNRIYTGKPLHGGSGVAILTNLTGGELNRLYAPFMAKGYRVAYFQGNTLGHIVEGDLLEPCSQIILRSSSYRKIERPKEAKNLSGSLNINDYNDLLKKIKKEHDDRFFDNSSEAFVRLQKTFGGKIDALILLGFDKGKKSAWLRCIDMRDITITCIRSGIEGKTIDDIAEKAITELTAKPVSHKN